jgi:hypothetical protein
MVVAVTVDIMVAAIMVIFMVGMGTVGMVVSGADTVARGGAGMAAAGNGTPLMVEFGFVVDRRV